MGHLPVCFQKLLMPGGGGGGSAREGGGRALQEMADALPNLGSNVGISATEFCLHWFCWLALIFYGVIQPHFHKFLAR